MPTRKRVRPSQAGTQVSNVQAYSVREFFAEFQNDDACLTRIMEVRYGLRHVCGKCGKEASFHKLADRRAYSCAQCGHHVYPCAGTIFQDSRTSLQVWFYALYLFIATRPWRVRQGASADARRDLQDGLAHGAANPHPDGQR